MKDGERRNGGTWLPTVLTSPPMLVVSALLASCSDGYETMSAQPYDTDYEVFSVVSRAGNLDLFLIKAFESEGKVALCGGYTLGTSSFSSIGNRRWADLSQVYIEDVKIGQSSFMAQMPVYGFKEGQDPKALFLALLEEPPDLPCVRSRVPWKAEFGSAKIERRGPKRLRIAD